jgi:butyrate kinase
MVNINPTEMGGNFCILAIKPEFEQTKFGLYTLHSLLFLKSIVHPKEELAVFKNNTDQYVYRAKTIMDELANADIDIRTIQVIIARGGLIKPIKSGVYEVNEAMKYDLRNSPVGIHSVNIGGLIADYMASLIPGSKAYIADPAVVDEMDEIARFTGIPEIKRKSIFHALNHKYVARKYANSIGKQYNQLNLIVAHLGDGISIGAHKQGKVVDVNQCFDGEGPFSLERAGTIPMVDLVKWCFSGKHTQEQILKTIRNEGGIFAYTGSSAYYSLDKATQQKNSAVLELFEAMAYQISKHIGYMAPVFEAPVDAIIVTGSLANNKWFTGIINKRIKFIAPVTIYPGEDVLDALAMNGSMVLMGEIPVLTYE